MGTEKKTYLTAGAFIAIIIGVLFALNSGANQIDLSVATSTPSIQTEVKTSAVVSESTPAPVQQIKTIANTTTGVPETIPAPALNFTLSVDGNSYATFVPVGSTVLDAMRSLTSTSSFVFTGRDYPSLGFFVESINGKKAESSHNWILYINGKLSGTGASQTTLSAGDSVEWRYEKNY